MDKRDRKAIATALKRAKKKLSTGATNDHGYTYICFALENQSSAERNARDVIMERLGGAMSMFSWLRDKCSIPEDELDFASVQQHRHAWLDRLIEEFSQ